MAQARDELFLKLALRQGLFSQQEAREFLIRYRTEGARGEGIGHWLVEEGIVAPEMAAQIRAAIAQRADGHVDTARRRVPKRAGGGAPPPSNHRPIRRTSAPKGMKVTPTQQVVYIGSIVAVVGLVMFFVFKYQETDPTSYTDATADRELSEGEKAANEILNAEVAPAIAEIPQTPTWTDQEIKSMTAEIRDAIGLARNHAGDGRPGRGIASIEKRIVKLGGSIPPEAQALADTELAELRTIADETYADLMADLKKARDAGDDAAAEDLILEIEDTCGADYAKRARGE